MKKLITILFVCILGTAGIARNMEGLALVTNDTSKMAFPCEQFLGKWVACVSPNDTVEINFEKRVIYSTWVKMYCECVMGSVKRVQNGKTIIDQPIEYTVQEDDKTLLQGKTRSKNLLSLQYAENGQNKDIGDVDFILQNDKKTAIWKLKSSRECFFGEKYDPFLLPAKMTFTKK